MSNDKTTLADVQPGGRVRLGDQAERAQFEAWVKNHVSSLARAADGDYASNFTHALWSAWQAALSAQPSPATCKEGLQVQPSPSGQGDTRIPFETWAKDGGFDVSKFKGIYNSLETRAAWGAWLYWQRRSAQPSPGGQGALDCIGRIEEAIEFRVPHDIYAAVHGELAELKAALAARQPVGEPVADAGRSAAYDAIDRFLRNNMDDEAYAAYVEHLEALWAAVPAQAVDLGKFRDLAEFALRNAKFHNCSVKREALARELLALIDSHGSSND